MSENAPHSRICTYATRYHGEPPERLAVVGCPVHQREDTTGIAIERVRVELRQIGDRLTALVPAREER